MSLLSRRIKVLTAVAMGCSWRALRRSGGIGTRLPKISVPCKILVLKRLAGNAVSGVQGGMEGKKAGFQAYFGLFWRRGAYFGFSFTEPDETRFAARLPNLVLIHALQPSLKHQKNSRNFIQWDESFPLVFFKNSGMSRL